MKLFISLILCYFALFVSANEHFDQDSNLCRCVNRDLCNRDYKFSSLIEPRKLEAFQRDLPHHEDSLLAIESATKYCPDDQICCANEDIISKADENSFKNEMQQNFAKCGSRKKISAYGRIILPPTWCELGEIPWHVAIFEDISDGFLFLSSGVLINENSIVTTAHNLKKLQASDIIIRLGENNAQADPKDKFKHVNAKVKKIIIKHDFNNDTLENDFAIICLENQVRFNEVISPVCLPEPNDRIDQTSRCTISGWGKGSYKGKFSTILRKADLNLVSHKRCQHLIRKRISDPAYILDKSFICAGGEFGKDACTGDAGGPLTCKNQDGSQVLVGIVSWGIGCGEKDVPGVYSNLRDPDSLNWIKTTANDQCNEFNDHKVRQQNLEQMNFVKSNSPFNGDLSRSTNEPFIEIY